MRRSLFIVAVFILMAVSGRDAHAAKFGTQDSLQLLQELTTRGPQGEALALGYVTTTHFFFLPYNMTGDYVLIVAGGGRDLHGRAIDVYHRLPKEKIEEMQRAGELPNPLPPYRHTIVNYLWAYMLWWSIPMVFVVIGFFSRGSGIHGETRST